MATERDRNEEFLQKWEKMSPDETLEVANLAMEGGLLEELLLNSVANDKNRFLSRLRLPSRLTKRILRLFTDYKKRAKKIGFI